MLNEVVATYGAVFVLVVFVLGCAMLVGLAGEWYVLQNEAAFLAASQAKYGGYTQEANVDLQRFVSERHIDRSRLSVEVSAPGSPVPWGTPVTARVTYNFPFRLGKWASFDVPVTGAGRAVSAYVPGAYDVTYTYPSW
ncbi:hypothetical protein SAMN02745218_01195 [Desulfofundulus australicus DSM 11792]|uniref:Uncharacterized protein n=1 Tax=Desulfofundulus australicus DSM 11792 TaxID=1121425 RepID=A0A1M4XWB3_9FIRM|nr:hypothetical protein [Desulfofundulus australicus]SHE97781.1 hypothetical protein SAMN02745218_01195 [Desulfofundulus australicus DSM 11792]